MSRSGYIDDVDDVLTFGRYRASVNRAMGGKRGQAFLKEMLKAMSKFAHRKLIAGELVVPPKRWEEKDVADVCAIGSVAVARGIDVTGIDPEDAEKVAATFGIAVSMAREIVYMNDEAGEETPFQRYKRMRAWIKGLIR